MDFDLATALTQLPRKGEPSFPFLTQTHSRSQRVKPQWKVHENLHAWAQKQGFLTGCIFKQTKKSSTKYCLLLVGPCPWTPGKLRYYKMSLTPLEISCD